MKHIKVVEFPMEYATRLLGLINIVEHVILDGTGHESTRAICDRENYVIYFNKQWLEKASNLEIFECALHECRHCFQQACIDYPETISFEKKEMVIAWKREFSNPVNPLLDEEKYLYQKSEVDATEFSLNSIIEFINHSIICK